MAPGWLLQRAFDQTDHEKKGIGLESVSNIVHRVACGSLLVMLSVSTARAEFTLNFVPVGTGTISTSIVNVDNGTDPDSNQTPYLRSGFYQLPEIVTDAATGKDYYHMIVGDLADGFIQESYVELGFGGYGNPGEPANAASASGGDGAYNSVTTFGNGFAPLAPNAGNGSGNPTRIIMRQIVNDGEIMMEFLKDGFDSKPKISQILVAPDITTFFDVDMRGISYSDDTTVAPMINTVQLQGEGVPTDLSGDFDMSINSADNFINAGKYIYTDGIGFGGSEGTYNYSDGGFDHEAINWTEYLDRSTDGLGNPVNPWAFESAKP